jgi:hypothetical protein
VLSVLLVLLGLCELLVLSVLLVLLGLCELLVLLGLCESYSALSYPALSHSALSHSALSHAAHLGDEYGVEAAKHNLRHLKIALENVRVLRLIRGIRY